MTCPGCSQESANFYGYRGGHLCPDCFSKVRTGSSSEKKLIEERLKTAVREDEIAREKQELEPETDLSWIGVLVMVIGGLFFGFSWYAEESWRRTMLGVGIITILMGLWQVWFAWRARNKLRKLK